MVDVVHFFQDLKKWKTRRRSTKSELRTKSQDREHVMDKMINGSVTTIEKNEAKLKYVCATIVFKKNKFLNIFKQCLMYSYLQWHERIFLLFIHLSLAYLFQIIDQIIIIILDKDDLNKHKRFFFNNLIY